MLPGGKSTYCEERPFRGIALVPSIDSQLTPWPISVTVLIINMLMLYPTYKWSKFSLISALWAVIGSVISLLRVYDADQVPMVVAYNMPFNLPLAIGSNIIRLSLEDGTKGFKERWKTFFAVIRGKSPQYTSPKTDYLIKTSVDQPELYLFYRIEELSRLLALIVGLTAMMWGVVRVWEWWIPFNAINDSMCLARFPDNIHVTVENPSCGYVIKDWSQVKYDVCVQFEPAVGWFLIIVYTALCAALILGIIVIRGYFIWALGGVGTAILIVISGLQSTYSTNSYCVEFVANLMNLQQIPQIISHQSLINLWWYRFGLAQWIIHLFTVHG
ncbi:hypothetical protein C1645_821313 [Glomus cerebriforme]|uniref:Uncharacterized protein n=1 Tax=Glomus cerebriforme TaxID=658196 RepID=A0A397T4W5_9GLOM|nr:hypothetical protein C1645_821313 [Glomus cerebriforme]